MIRLLLALVVAVAFGGLIVQEMADDTAPAPPPTTVPAPLQPARSPQIAASERAAQRQAWVQTALARPLFEPSRRPPVAGETAPTPAAVLPRLSGVLVSAAGRQVIFAGSDGKPAVLSEGGKLDGFTVQSISIGEVTMLGPDGVHVLRPSFDPNRQPATSPNPQVSAFRPGLTLPGAPGGFASPGLFGSPGPPNASPFGNLNIPLQPQVANNFDGRLRAPQIGNAAPGAQ
jgi:general secretion pathway protein N